MGSQYPGFSARLFLAGFAVWLLLVALALPAAAQATERPAGWTEASHGNDALPDYEIALPAGRVNELYIRFSAESWEAEEADMIEIYGERGQGERGARGDLARPGGARGPGRQSQVMDLMQPDPAQLAAALGVDADTVAEAMRLMPDFQAAIDRLGVAPAAVIEALGLPPGFEPPAEFGRAGRDLELASRNPIWVPVTITFGEQTWLEVGFRYKGHSTLSLGWRGGIRDLPFKLDFDEFEDDHPALKNQRFFGFKQLSFGRSAFDPSLQRDKVTSEIFRAAGLPSSVGAYYAVYVDTGAGDGYEYWGVYTALELPDDTLIETQFADDDGNMYKPSGAGATFAAGSFDEEYFDKETNKSGSYDDVLALFAALQNETRKSDPAAWRAGLEAVFDVDGFIRWLAATTLIQNWDTYGVMPHNYYLYADAATGRLVWIPWDNNMALSSTTGARGGNPGRQNQPLPGPRGSVAPNIREALSLSLEDVDAERWPLIGFLLEIDDYANRYIELVAEISAGAFAPERMEAIYNREFELLAAYVAELEGEAAVVALRETADELIAHAWERAKAAEEFLAAAAR